MLSHENALSFVNWCSDTFAPSEVDRFSSHAPFHFDLSVLDIYLPLKHGAAVYVISEELGKSPKELARFIESSALTIWYSTPSILSLLAEFGDLAVRDCRALRVVLFAGEVFPVKHLRDVTRLWPWARVLQPLRAHRNERLHVRADTAPDSGRPDDAVSHRLAMRTLRDDGARCRGGE